MEFEFDPKKSRQNKTKHGIDFIEAQALWNDPDIVQIPVKISNETRFFVIGTIAGYSDEVGHALWSKGTICYDPNRPPVPGQSGHPL
jgi:uncharacterized DUF497 family protein